jgi:hypothetical protein
MRIVAAIALVASILALAPPALAQDGGRPVAPERLWEPTAEPAPLGPARSDGGGVAPAFAVILLLAAAAAGYAVTALRPTRA